MSLVTWTDDARDQLADVYVSLPTAEKAVMVSAVDRIERVLADNAQFEGESRSGNQRVYILSPLAVVYAVIPHGPVKIIRVRPSRRRRR
ncbi:MAG: type II toxin-antitoxin system RelE/ParE family toxin [Fimbriiglobus sp.]